MRTTQFIGLNNRARMFIINNALHTEYKKCEHCGAEKKPIPIMDPSEKVEGMFGEEVHQLHVYKTTKHPSRFEEFVQAEPWSSGPVIFTALRWVDTKRPIEETLWTEEEMSDYI